MNLCLLGLSLGFAACEKSSDIDELPQLVVAQQAKQASQSAKINVKSVVTLDSRDDTFQSLLTSQPFQNFLVRFPQGLDISTLRMATFDLSAGESAIVGKVMNSNIEFVAYLVNINGSVEYRIILKDQRVTSDRKGLYSGDFTLLNESGQVVKKIMIHKNRITKVMIPHQDALFRKSCFGQCVETANDEIESDMLSYIACSINPCWIAIAAACAYECS